MTVKPLQPQIHKRKCRRFFHFLIITAVLGLVLWIRRGEAIVGAMLRVEAFFSEGEVRYVIFIPHFLVLLRFSSTRLKGPHL
jgi:hypothetical protein